MSWESDLTAMANTTSNLTCVTPHIHHHAGNASVLYTRRRVLVTQQ